MKATKILQKAAGCYTWVLQVDQVDGEGEAEGCELTTHLRGKRLVLTLLKKVGYSTWFINHYWNDRYAVFFRNKKGTLEEIIAWGDDPYIFQVYRKD